MFYQEKIFEHVKYAKRTTIVTLEGIVATDIGVTCVRAAGIAKLHPRDTCNKKLGYELARKRAERKLNRKIENILIDYSKKKSKLKEYREDRYHSTYIFDEILNAFKKGY